MLHYASALTGECGEVSECIMKHFKGDALDVENLLEEHGDIKFYERALLVLNEITDEQAENHNINKLAIRYKGKYSDKAAKERVDKQEANE